MNIADQYQNINRMLAQRMMRHAESVLRQWAQELARFDYFDRLSSLSQNYDYTFSYYLSTPVHYMGDPAGVIDDDRDSILSDLTRQYYLLADEMYASLLLKQGIAPTLYGFGANNRESAINYFSRCVALRDEDIDWLVELSNQSDQPAFAILVISAMAAGLRNVFQFNAFRALITISKADNQMVAEQAVAHLILLAAYYDVRLDFFPDLQDEISDLFHDSQRPLQVMCALIESSKPRQEVPDEELLDSLPEELYDVLEANRENIGEKINAEISQAQPFVTDIVTILPGTWVFTQIAAEDKTREFVAKLYVSIGRNEEAFEGVLMNRGDLIHDAELKADYALYNELYDEALTGYQALEEQGLSSPKIRFRIGWCALMTMDLELAEKYMVARLRESEPWVEDYLNYAHLCFIKGDKVSAFEYYREARTRAGSMKNFKATFCPDRRVLADMGIPLQEIYLMEDRLLHP